MDLKPFVEIDFKSLDIDKCKTSYQLHNFSLTLSKVNSKQPKHSNNNKQKPTATTNALKVSKYVLKGSKFYSHDVDRPLLDIRYCEGANSS